MLTNKAREDLLSSPSSHPLLICLLTCADHGTSDKGALMTSHDWSYVFPCHIVFTNMLSHNDVIV